MTSCPAHPRYRGALLPPDGACGPCQSIYAKRHPLCLCGCGDRVKLSDRRDGTKYATRACAGRDRTRSVDARLDQTWTVNGNGTATVERRTAENVRTLADLIRVCQIDTSEWQVAKWQCKASQQASVPRATRIRAGDSWVRPSTEPVLTQMFHVSAELVHKTSIVEARTELAAMKADAKATAAPRRLVTPPRASDRDCLLELAIPDLHLGKLAWGQETGGSNYDVKLAQQCFEDALDALIARTAGHRFAEVLLVLGHDFFHTDNKAQTTYGGTPLEADGRFHKTFLIGRRMIVRAIEQRLAPLAPSIIVPVVPGNHDTLSAWHLGDSLECWFHHTPSVTIDNGPNLRKYHRYGTTLLGFTHGDKGKKIDYPLLMAQERKQDWADTTHREIHIGHRHESSLIEKHGIRIRTSPALCAADAWHAEQGFIGNQRAAEAFVWHKTDGHIATAHYTIK